MPLTNVTIFGWKEKPTTSFLEKGSASCIVDCLWLFSMVKPIFMIGSIGKSLFLWMDNFSSDMPDTLDLLIFPRFP